MNATSSQCSVITADRQSLTQKRSFGIVEISQVSQSCKAHKMRRPRQFFRFPSLNAQALGCKSTQKTLDCSCTCGSPSFLGLK